MLQGLPYVGDKLITTDKHLRHKTENLVLLSFFDNSNLLVLNKCFGVFHSSFTLT